MKNREEMSAEYNGFNTANKALMERLPFVVDKVHTGKGADLTLVATDGRELRFFLTADCCSASYFTDYAILDAKALIGHTLLELRCDPIGGPEPREPTHEEQTVADDIKCHVLYIRTDRASLSIDWRNDSNGCYDGQLSVEVA